MEAIHGGGQIVDAVPGDLERHKGEEEQNEGVPTALILQIALVYWRGVTLLS